MRELKKLLRERARLVARIRRFFDEQDFVEVQTPVMVPSPGLDLHLDAFEVAGGDRRAARWLVTSPEYQMKRLLGAGFERIYQVGPCFRRDEIGPIHNSEFTMLEWYRANASIEDIMGDTERLVAIVSGGRITLDERSLDLTPPFLRITVCEAFRQFAGWSEAEVLYAAAHDEDRYFRALVEHVEPALERIDEGLLLVDYPASQASLARKKPADPRFAERFELYVAGVELCNGFGELVDPVEQRERLLHDQALRKARNLPAYPIDERFLRALAQVPPSAGNALGLDRLVALACGSRTIAEVMAFTADEL